MKNLYIHIGPYKTGSTAIQKILYAQRKQLLSQGWLYPETGLITENTRWGERHLFLFHKNTTDQLWADLQAEIDASDAPNIILSSERVCGMMNHLLFRKDFLASFKPHIVVFVRDEVDLLRSWYLQIIKSRILKKKNLLKGPKLRSFPAFFRVTKDSFCYSAILRDWIDVYGAESVLLIPYLKDKGYDSRKELYQALNISWTPPVETATRSNSSITPFCAFICLEAAKRTRRWLSNRPLGWTGLHTHFAAEIASLMNSIAKYESKQPMLANWNISKFDEAEIRRYYDTNNQEFMSANQSFRDAYRLALQSRRPPFDARIGDPSYLTLKICKDSMLQDLKNHTGMETPLTPFDEHMDELPLVLHQLREENLELQAALQQSREEIEILASQLQLLQQLLDTYFVKATELDQLIQQGKQSFLPHRWARLHMLPRIVLKRLIMITFP